LEEVNIIELIDRRKGFNSMAMALVFTPFTLLAGVSCRAVPGSPVIPYLNLYF